MKNNEHKYLTNETQFTVLSSTRCPYMSFSNLFC